MVHANCGNQLHIDDHACTQPNKTPFSHDVCYCCCLSKHLYTHFEAISTALAAFAATSAASTPGTPLGASGLAVAASAAALGALLAAAPALLATWQQQAEQGRGRITH